MSKKKNDAQLYAYRRDSVLPQRAKISRTMKDQNFIVMATELLQSGKAI
jgi:hypothetical protein